MKITIFSVLLSIMSLCLFGQKIPEINAQDLEQRLRAGRDTTYVINFWATWCIPCRKELPYFERLQAELSEQKVKVLLVSMDFRTKANTQVANFVKKYKVKSEVLLINENPQLFVGKINKNWEGSIPATLIVNTSKAFRRFYEKEFTYDELLKEFDLK